MQFIAEELHSHLLKCGHRDTAAPVSHYLQQKQLVAMVKLNNHPLWVKSRNISRCNRYVHFTPQKRTCAAPHARFGPKADSCRAAKRTAIRSLVGAGEQRGWDGDAAQQWTMTAALTLPKTK